VFEHRWAVALLGEVMQRLEADYGQEGKAELFSALQPCLVGDRERLPYPQLAAQLGESEGAARVSVHRLRQRYRDLLRTEIAHTLATAEDVDTEMRHLFKVLAQGGVENSP
jgi:RNA polymerase sigma-70 factor (ECF subfamily)